jgi:hypothetical protein
MDTANGGKKTLESVEQSTEQAKNRRGERITGTGNHGV